ncbi:MAG: glycerol-3-phosphate dehydrogenase [Flavobacteriales bacterium]|nr:MAG: glycerol-3-phosphate dehydrogenase [Flavobacteriales bacterium]
MQNKKEFPKVAVFGGGSWATALVKILSEKLTEIGWYMRNEQTIEYIKKNRRNRNYISSVEFKPEQLLLSSNIDELITYADYLILAIPSAFLNEALNKVNVIPTDKVIFSAIKGIVPESGKIVGEYLNEKYNIPYRNIGVITGPCHAEEVALERLSYLTIACQDETKAKIMADMLNNRYIITKISDDIVGTEYAAVLKNIYAIAAGIAHGLRYGDNFQAVLMANATREMKRFIKKVHKVKRNINHTAYLGDLLVTGYSSFSRNRMFGNMIGKGYTVKSAIMEMNMIAEGFYAVKSAYKISQIKSAKTPIIDTVYRILYENKNQKKEFKEQNEKV